MAFPEEIDVFPVMSDITASDGDLIKQYQAAMEINNLALAKQILQTIPNSQNKIITAELLNKMINSIVSVQDYTLKSYSPAYVVSETMPTNQEATDFWFQVTG